MVLTSAILVLPFLSPLKYSLPVFIQIKTFKRARNKDQSPSSNPTPNKAFSNWLIYKTFLSSEHLKHQLHLSSGTQHALNYVHIYPFIDLVLYPQQTEHPDCRNHLVFLCISHLLPRIGEIMTMMQMIEFLASDWHTTLYSNFFYYTLAHVKRAKILTKLF